MKLTKKTRVRLTSELCIAMACAYTTKRNEKKAMDIDLINDSVDKVIKCLEKEFNLTEESIGERKMYRHTVLTRTGITYKTKWSNTQKVNLKYGEVIILTEKKGASNELKRNQRTL